MSPLILIAVSVVAISILVAANMWLGGWTRSRIPSLEAAKQRLEEDYLTFQTGEGVLAKDGQAALIAEEAGPRTGLVLAQGDILVSRLVSSSEVASADLEGCELKMRFHDFTLPVARLEFESEEIAAHWQSRLTEREAAHA